MSLHDILIVIGVLEAIAIFVVLGVGLWTDPAVVHWRKNRRRSI